MKIGIFGTGYVGLVTGVCFAELGNSVTCVDINEEKIALLNKGKSPIYEPGLDNLMTRNLREGRLSFTTEPSTVYESSDLIFIAVGTPQSDDGSADLRFVDQVARQLAENLTKSCYVVTKSTVPVGTSMRLQKIINDILQQRKAGFEITIISNPEFLREGAAVQDCLEPSRVIVGCYTDGAQEIMTRLYSPFVKDGSQIIFMDPYSSEMTKYSSNAMLALKISFMNEMSRICEAMGADIESVKKGMGADPRIGPHFINPGLGYGGSCFPKDVRALMKIAEIGRAPSNMLVATDESNEIQRKHFLNRILKHFNGNVNGKKIGVWGIAFKPNTDDIREAPAIFLMEELAASGAEVFAYDPEAMPNAKAQLAKATNIKFAKDPYSAIEGVDFMIVATEWKVFREPDFARMRSLLKAPIIFDGRNIYDPLYMKEIGFQYFSVGR